MTNRHGKNRSAKRRMGHKRPAPSDRKPDSITCPVCMMTSYNPTDIAEGYCGNCHDWTSK
jgi:hypothetical protein